MQTTRPAIMRGVQQHRASKQTSFYWQSQVLGEVRKRELVGQMMGFCFYSRDYGTPLEAYREGMDMLRFVFAKVPSRWNVKNKWNWGAWQPRMSLN